MPMYDQTWGKSQAIEISWENEKMLVASVFHFSHKGLFHFKKMDFVFIHFQICFMQILSIWWKVNLFLVENSVLYHTYSSLLKVAI